MKKIALIVSIAFILLAVPIALLADLYMWTDSNGIIHISDEPPLAGGTRTEEPQQLSFDEGKSNHRNLQEVDALREADIAFDSKHYRKALTLFRPLADRGNPRAQNTLGLIYGRGLGVQKDLNAAMTWHQKAARQGYAPAQFYMGLMYADGQGVPRNADEGIKWLRKAAEQGLSEAQFTLWTIYATGEGNEQDSRQAVRWYREAAEQGHAFAQHNLALMYADGDGVVRDEIKALHWEQKAAAAGDPNAQYRLATLYATGRSVSQSYEEAFGWFRKAVAQGYPLSINLDKGWSMGYYARVPNDYVLIELIKQGDNINKWKELLTIAARPGSAQREAGSPG